MQKNAEKDCNNFCFLNCFGKYYIKIFALLILRKNCFFKYLAYGWMREDNFL
jgi:hypothetical protein